MPLTQGKQIQEEMCPTERRQRGVHYTSQEDILRVIKPLFLDALQSEFEQVKEDANKLKRFQQKLTKLQFLDPACGCGDFLTAACQELQKIEYKVLKRLDDAPVSRVSLQQFYGIECDAAAAKTVAGANIVVGNALKLDWNSVVPREELHYILGNPPFVGSRRMNKEQKNEIRSLFKESKHAGELDYVAGWYKLAADYLQGTDIQAAFVSTNSITQGLQVGVLWEYLLAQGITIHFAHRTFPWHSDAAGKAAVQCVIIGFSDGKKEHDKKLFSHHLESNKPQVKSVRKISPYLVEGESVLLRPRSKPLCDVPPMFFGNMPADGGYLLFNDEEKKAFLHEEPQAKPHIRPLISGREFIHGRRRWCLWLEDITPEVLETMPLVLARVSQVQAIRERSSRPHLAKVPHLFAQITQPRENYIVVPCTTSEHREYLPLDYLTENDIVHNSCHCIGGGSLYHLGVLLSKMHHVWLHHVCGRLKSDIRYSKEIVYNNFPWPSSPDAKEEEVVVQEVREVLAARQAFPGRSFAELYAPKKMPASLLQAHQRLDAVVDRCYQVKPFGSSDARIRFLFDLHQKYTESIALLS